MKKYYKIPLTAVVLAGLGLASCTKDFIVPDISDESVVLLSPPGGHITSVQQVTFWWEKVEDAEGYNIQVVSPSFSNTQAFIINANIDSNFYTLSLQPGVYQWRVKAYNSAHETPYSVRTLTIDSTSDLSAQTVTLSSPQANYFTNQVTVTFTWNILYSATEYRIVIQNTVNGNTEFDDTIQTNGYIRTLPAGSYQWQVRAQNVTSNSAYSTPRLLTIDLTPPSVSVPGSPANNALVTNPVNLAWLRNGNATGDSLFIDTDSTFLSPDLLEYTTQQTYLFNGLTDSIYFWRLRSVDAAGNASGYSTAYKFKIQ